MKTAREILIEELEKVSVPAAENARILDYETLRRVAPIIAAALAAVERALGSAVPAPEAGEPRFLVIRRQPHIMGGLSFQIEHGDRSKDYSKDDRQEIADRWQLPQGFLGTIREARELYAHARKGNANG